MNGAAAVFTPSVTEVIALTTSDDYPLAAVLYRPVSVAESGASQARKPKQHPVLVSAALGVPQRFYAPFCSWLASRGYTVMTFDLRGIGASLQKDHPHASARSPTVTFCTENKGTPI